MVRVLMDEVVTTDYGQLDLWFTDDVDDDGDIEATFAYWHESWGSNR